MKYKNFTLEPCSYQLVASRKWQPKLMLYEDRLSEVVAVPLLWNKTFDTKKEADEYALIQTRMFIDLKKQGARA